MILKKRPSARKDVPPRKLKKYYSNHLLLRSKNSAILNSMIAYSDLFANEVSECFPLSYLAFSDASTDDGSDYVHIVPYPVENV